MADTKYLKCLCAHCAGHIEFPADGIGMTAPCPHCGWQTELTLEAPAPAAAPSSRSRKWVIAGVVILAVGFIAAVGAVMLAQKLVKKQRAQRAAVQSGARPTKANAGPSPSVPARTKRADTINDFSVHEVKIEKAGTLVYAVGTLKNETDKQRFGITVEIEMLDSAGEKIGAAKDYKDSVEPRGQWTFRALLVKKEAAAVRVASIQEQL